MFLLKPLFDCFCWSAARLPHSTSCCRGRCSIASLDRLLLALVLKHACAEALAVRSLSIPNRWAVPLITAGLAVRVSAACFCFVFLLKPLFDCLSISFC